jgi:Domain of unknown function (DUF4387)
VVSDDPHPNLSNVTRCFTLIRSKDAGPFMLTIDLFFSDEHSQRAFREAGTLSPERIGALYGVDPCQVQVFDMDDIRAMKISFPRPVPSGEFGDTDITGGQQYSVLVEMIAGLSIEGEGPGLVVRDPTR